MLGLLPLITALLLLSRTTAHDAATANATYVLQLPLNLLHCAANCSTATQLLRETTEDSCPIFDKQVSWAASLSLKLHRLLIYANI